MQFEDILYEVRSGFAWITINRPEKMRGVVFAEERLLARMAGIVLAGAPALASARA